jgi:hypothetical protein
VNEMEPSALARKIRNDILALPLCANECPKVDRRTPKNELLIQRRINRVMPILGIWRCHWMNQRPTI